MGVSINELLDVIKKSGLPIGDKLTKTTNQLANEDTLRSGVQGLYQPQINQLDDEKKQKIQQLANVDRQFAQLFGQGGKYQLRNPMDTEALTSGGQNIALSDFNRVATQKENLLKTFENDVTRATTLYGKIDPTSAENVGLGDLAYIKSQYGIDVPGLDNTKESDWEVDVPDTEWEIQGNNLQGTDRINRPLG